MNGSNTLPSIDALKEEARRLRAERQAAGTRLTHSQSLELIAKQYGFRDWNAMYAAAAHTPPRAPVSVGDAVRGVYLGQPFLGKVLRLDTLSPSGRFRVVIHFDQPVDVVTFDSFSSFRHRVACTVDAAGKSAEKTSDGRPQMHLERVAAGTC